MLKDTTNSNNNSSSKRKRKTKAFTLVSLDESFLFYDTLVRRVVWIDEEKKPVVRITGLHKHSCLFGAISLDGRQLFRQYQNFNGDTFLDFLKMIHSRFPNVICLWTRPLLITNQRR